MISHQGLLPPMLPEPPVNRSPDLGLPAENSLPEPELEDEQPPVLEAYNAPQPQLPPVEVMKEDNESVFNFTEDEEPPPPLHGDGKKGKSPR